MGISDTKGVTVSVQGGQNHAHGHLNDPEAKIERIKEQLVAKKGDKPVANEDFFDQKKEKRGDGFGGRIFGTTETPKKVGGEMKDPVKQNLIATISAQEEEMILLEEELRKEKEKNVVSLEKITELKQEIGELQKKILILERPIETANPQTSPKLRPIIKKPSIRLAGTTNTVDIKQGEQVGTILPVNTTQETEEKTTESNTAQDNHHTIDLSHPKFDEAIQKAQGEEEIDKIIEVVEEEPFIPQEEGLVKNVEGVAQQVDETLSNVPSKDELVTPQASTEEEPKQTKEVTEDTITPQPIQIRLDDKGNILKQENSVALKMSTVSSLVEKLSGNWAHATNASSYAVSAVGDETEHRLAA